MEVSDCALTSPPWTAPCRCGSTLAVMSPCSAGPEMPLSAPMGMMASTTQPAGAIPYSASATPLSTSPTSSARASPSAGTTRRTSPACTSTVSTPTTASDSPVCSSVQP
jgi:hypothetical protein